MEFVPITPHYDAAMAAIVRAALEEHGLDIPGTAYFDAALDSLSAFYDRPGRAYYVLLDGETVIGVEHGDEWSKVSARGREGCAFCTVSILRISRC